VPGVFRLAKGAALIGDDPAGDGEAERPSVGSPRGPGRVVRRLSLVKGDSRRRGSLALARHLDDEMFPRPLPRSSFRLSAGTAPGYADRDRDAAAAPRACDDGIENAPQRD
jgi:hypothetical protein